MKAARVLAALTCSVSNAGDLDKTIREKVNGLHVSALELFDIGNIQLAACDALTSLPIRSLLVALPQDYDVADIVRTLSLWHDLDSLSLNFSLDGMKYGIQSEMNVDFPPFSLEIFLRFAGLRIFTIDTALEAETVTCLLACAPQLTSFACFRSLSDRQCRRYECLCRISGDFFADLCAL